MLVRMKTTAAGSWSAKPGDLRDRPEEEALRLCKAGMAEPVEPMTAAAAETGETTTAAETGETTQRKTTRRTTRKTKA